MPLKFSIYIRVCYLAILISLTILLEYIYLLTRTSIRVDVPVLFALVLITFFACYFIIPILGLQLARCMANGDDVKQSTIITIRIFFIIQIVYQLLIIYYSPDVVRNLVLLMKRRFLFDTMDRLAALLGIGMLLLAVSTLYLEIFTFPMIKAVRRNYQAVLAQLDNLGN